MPDGTVPSSTEAMRAALSAARASLERQIRAARSDAAEDALRQVNSAMRLLPAERIQVIPEIAWVEADVQTASPSTTSQAAMAEANPLDRAASDSSDTAADDLTRIRGIDDVLAKRLAALGIQRFAQIAAWQPDDVRAIADAMGLGRRFIAMGIVEQATDLVRAEADARAKTQFPVSPTAAGLQAVAVWEPNVADNDTAATLVRAPSIWRPLEGHDLKSVIAVIRTKRAMNTLVRLCDVAPALNEPIFIATDHDAAVELPRWRTGVLVPFVEARAAPDLTQVGRPGASQRSTDLSVPGHTAASKAAPPNTATTRVPASVEAARAIAAFHAAVAASPAPVQSTAPVRATPLHETATSRIADLEAELEQFGHVDRPTTPVDEIATSATKPKGTGRRVAEPPASAHSGHHGTFGSRDDVAEADVKIVVGARSKAPMLAPLPALPLTARPRSAGRRGPDDAPTDGMPNYGSVEEAAVVIVRRNTAEPAAGGLAFYAARPVETQSGRPSGIQSGPVRRFMRALAGS